MDDREPDCPRCLEKGRKGKTEFDPKNDEWFCWRCPWSLPALELTDL